MPRFSHGVVAVANMEASCRFYGEGLGFKQTSDDWIDADFGRLLGVDAKGARSVMFADAYGVAPVVELLDFGGAAVRPSAHAGPLTIGVCVISVSADLDGVGERLKASGYNPYLGRETIAAHNVEIGVVRDPDGVYIELLPPFPMPSEDGGEPRMRSGLDHTAIAVVDLEASNQFYRDGLGLDFWDVGYTETNYHMIVSAHSRVVKSTMLGGLEGELDKPRIELADFHHGAGPKPMTDSFHVGIFMHVVHGDLDETERRVASLGGDAKVVHDEIDWHGSKVPVMVLRDPDDEHVAVLPEDA